MFPGLVKWCGRAVLCSRGPRRTAASNSASVSACLLLAFAILLQPGSRYQHAAQAASWGHLWGKETGGDGSTDNGEVQLSHDFREPVLAGLFHWSEYGAWTSCTASCGTGVEGRRRICIDESNVEVPAENCPGYQRQYRLCRIQNCPNSFDLGYRASRCQEMAPRDQRWKPYYPSERDAYSPCTLICYNEERHGEVRVVERDVPSGTRCAKLRDGSPETGVCIEGLCLSVGCDGYLNSTTYPDRCGVCGGDGSSCAFVSDQIVSENLQVGYTDILEIPTGATNIKIAETHSIQNYLALVDLNGHYYVNGDVQRVEPIFSNNFRAAGTWFRYQRRNLYNGRQWEERESITAKGPTNGTLHLQILNFIYGSTNSLRYEYVIPLEEATSELEEGPYSTRVPPSVNPSPTLSIGGFDGNVSLDTLLETADVSRPLYPVNMTDINLENDKFLGLDDFDLMESLLEDNTRRNMTALPVRNKANGVSGNGPRTSDHAVQTESDRVGNATLERTSIDVAERTVTKTPRINTTWDETQVFTSDAHAQDVVLPVENTRDHEWSEGWPEIAEMERPNSGRIVLNRESVRPNMEDAPSSRRDDDTGGNEDGSDLVYGPPYRTEDATSNATAARFPASPGETGVVDSASAKSTITFATQTEEAPSPTHDDSPDIKQHEGDNKVGFESQVPEDMDMSESDYDDDFYSSDVENGLRLTTRAPSPERRRTTNAATSAPITSNPTNSVYTTVIESTTSLQTTTQLTPLKTSLPGTTSSAPTTEIATTESLPTNTWRITATMPCSATCTRGIIRNYAYCVDANERQVDDTVCDPKTKPDVIAKECTGRPCEPRWEVGSWSNCLGDCDASYRFRTVHCWLMFGEGLDTSVPANRCKASMKPNATRPCKEQNCRPQWIVSDWSTCSTPCGPGRQTRQVTCSEISGCDLTQRPERERVCNSGACTWSTSSWNRCSGTCTVQSRRVFCMAERTNQEDSMRVEDVLCAGNDKPLTTQLCGGAPCQPKWIPQTWGRCEGPCNNPYSRRRILCMGITRDGRILTLPNGRCSQERPANNQRCVKAGCPHRAEWKMSMWKPCSVTCGSGWQTREVRCLVGGRISDMCGALPRPASRRACNRTPCRADPPVIHRKIDACQDSETADCNLIVQASLCRYSRYKRTCCRSCANVAARSGVRGRK